MVETPGYMLEVITLEVRIETPKYSGLVIRRISQIATNMQRALIKILTPHITSDSSYRCQ